MSEKRTLMLKFIEPFKSAVLATVDEEFFPHASFAPFVHLDHNYYIFISELARHTKNLKTNCEVSVIFAEDESQCENIFARKRISLLCESSNILRDDVIFESVMSEFSKKFDQGMIETLLGMSDFHLYELTPLKGEAVFGFGEAYDVGGVHCEELIKRKGGTGHQGEKEK